MTDHYRPPAVPRPLRVLILGAAEPAWYQEAPDVQQEYVLPAMFSCFRRWSEEMGARCLGTFDDDLFMVGTPRTRQWSFYLLYEVPDLETITAMINLLRTPIGGIRLDRYFRAEALVGRGFFPVEAPPDTDGGTDKTTG